MIVTFTKLLVMRIVARVLSLSRRNWLIFLSVEFLSGSSSLRSDGDKLKKAISDALANPEKKSSKRARTAERHTPNVGVMK